MRLRNSGRWALLLSTCAGGASASAGFVQVYGGPTYDAATNTGYSGPSLPHVPGATAGNAMGVGNAVKLSAGTNLGFRAFRWDTSGAAAVELGNLGTTSTGGSDTHAYALNSGGAVAGFATKFVAGAPAGQRAVRWDSAGNATELETLGGDGTNQALAVNGAGTAVGTAEKIVGGFEMGIRPVRWDGNGTVATELGNLGTGSTGLTGGSGEAINSAGTAVGYVEKYTSTFDRGSRAVRWDAGGTAATELENLGVDGSGFTLSQAFAINTAGTAVGRADKQVSNDDLGFRAVRWDAGGTAATELGNLGISGSKSDTFSEALAINDLGVAVGRAEKFVGGTFLGIRAVRWDAGTTAATELGNLGTDSAGNTNSTAFAISPSGLVLGAADKYTAGTLVGQRAVVWATDGVAIDLNTLIDPNSGWTLTDAGGISGANWVTGIGSFDPDGAGPVSAYRRAFLLDVSGVVPEPAASSVFVVGALPLCRRRRRTSDSRPLRARGIDGDGARTD